VTQPEGRMPLHKLIWPSGFLIMKKILELKNVKLASLNKKYGGRNKVTGGMYLSKDYIATQEMIYLSLKKIKITSPIEVTIFVCSYKDSDNLIHSIINMIEKKGIIDNDREVNCLTVFKKPLKRGALDSVTVFIATSQMDYDLEMDCYNQMSGSKNYGNSKKETTINIPD